MRELDDAGTRALVAVQRLQATYGDAVTRRAWDEVRALFEPHAVVHIDTRTRRPFTLEGPNALVEFIEGALEPFVFFEFAILNAVAEVDGDQASGRVYICELRHDRAGQWTQAYGLYRDRYTRRDGAWRFAERSYASLARKGPTIESFPLPPM
jgi:SnoaL-like domain